MFEGLHIALSGIRAAQIGLDTATNNVVNATTPGHTRQRADLASLPPWRTAAGDVGMGVDVTAVSRLREGTGSCGTDRSRDSRPATGRTCATAGGSDPRRAGPGRDRRRGSPDAGGGRAVADAGAQPLQRRDESITLASLPDTVLTAELLTLADELGYAPERV